MTHFIGFLTWWGRSACHLGLPCQAVSLCKVGSTFDRSLALPKNLLHWSASLQLPIHSGGLWTHWGLRSRFPLCCISESSCGQVEPALHLPVSSVNMDSDLMACPRITGQISLWSSTLICPQLGKTRILHGMVHPDLQRALHPRPPTPLIFICQSSGNENLPGVGTFQGCNLWRRGCCVKQMVPIVFSSSLLSPLPLLAPPSSSFLFPDVAYESNVFS